jgi:hypothetical protein
MRVMQVLDQAFLGGPTVSVFVLKARIRSLISLLQLETTFYILGVFTLLYAGYRWNARVSLPHIPGPMPESFILGKLRKHAVGPYLKFSQETCRNFFRAKLVNLTSSTSVNTVM